MSSCRLLHETFFISATTSVTKFFILLTIVLKVLRSNPARCAQIEAGVEGLEPPTYGFGVRRSAIRATRLLYFLMGGMLAAHRAVFSGFLPLRLLLVLRCRVVPVLAFAASQRYLYSQLFSSLVTGERGSQTTFSPVAVRVVASPRFAHPCLPVVATAGLPVTTRGSSSRRRRRPSVRLHEWRTGSLLPARSS
jgi:hypothetical protein